MEAGLNDAHTDSTPISATPDSRPAGSSPTPASVPRRTALPLLGTLLLALLVSLGSIYLYDRFMAQKIVAVDLKGFLVEQKQAYLRGEIDDAELQRRMDDLERVVAGIPPRYAVLMGDVVVRNVEVVKP